MTRRAHVDDEMKPPANVLAALGQWLDANGLRRVALVEPLGSQQSRVTRLFAGETYLSATERRAIESFTAGAITAAMLEGKAPPPAKVATKRRAAVEISPEPEAPAEPAAVAPTVRPQTTEEAERIVDNLTARAMPAAFKVILEQMVKGKSESERRRCAEILIEHLRGKAKQYEKREQLVQPVSDEALLRKLREIEANLTGLPVDEYGRVIRPPQVKAPKDPA
jgi:DNA-binding transcriptional regulator YdaS (Cro superfamily)